jgi:hypothetical protein
MVAPRLSQASLKRGDLMLTLDLPVERTGSTCRAAAQAAASRQLGAIHAADADLDPDMARGLAFAFLVKSLARHAVTAWEGVGASAGAG